jgi:hypothetical protein
MTLQSLTKKTGALLANNSPVILTGLGVAGVLATAFLTGKATFKAANVIAMRQDPEYNSDMPDAKEKLQLVWKLYIPPAVAVFATVTAIVFSHKIDTRRAAAVAAAYAISERGWNEYKDKIVEKIGPKKEEAARDEIAQEYVTKNPPKGTVLVMGNNDVLCCDMWSRRYFRSTMEKIKTAMVNTNYKVINHDYASLTSFYDELGLEPTTESDDIGWNTACLLDLVFSHALTPDSEPCLTFEFRALPFRY